MSLNRFRSFGLVMRSGSSAVALLIPSIAHGQAAVSTISPLTVEPDHNKVNLTDGQITVDGPTLSVPAAPRLKYDLIQNAMPYIQGTITSSAGEYVESNVAVHYGGSASESFHCQNDDVCSNRKANGSVLDGSVANGGPYTFTLSPSGAVYQFDQLSYDSGTAVQKRQTWYYASSVTYPDGEVITYTYDTASTGTITRYRVNRVSSNLGFYLTFGYQGNDVNQNSWKAPAQVTLYNASATSTPLGQLTYGTNGSITDLANRVYNCTACGNAVGGSVEVASGTMTLPGEGSAEETVSSYQPIANNYAVPYFVSSVVRDGVNWAYSYGNVRTNTQNGGPGYTYDNVVVNGPAGYHETYNITTPVTGGANMISSIVNSLGNATSYQYDANYRPVRVTYPEGNYAQIAYDQWGNITSKISNPKSGSGQSAITETAAIDANGCSQDQVLCYRPTTYRDGLNNQTDYAYDAAGRLVQQTDPADGAGVRRVKYLTYDSSSFTGPTLVRTCGLNSTCGTNAEIRTQYTYWAGTGLPATETRVDGVTGVSLTTTYTYDTAGHLLVEDGPLSGTADAKYFRYDVVGRKTWEIGAADPSGTRLATRYTYRDSDDKVTVVETGTLPDQNSSSFSVTQRIDTGYDAHRNPAQVTTSANGTPYKVQHASYDDRGQQICDTVRMNPAAFGSLPGDACALGAQGSAGADRVTHNSYDAAGQLLQVQKAYGTSLQQNYATYSYTSNGKQASVQDANGNLASMSYDGFDRQVQWNFPSPTNTGTVSSTDYEAYGYDAGGNRTSLRKRDGRTIAYAYDALHRVASKSYPNGGARPVFYAYDMAGQVTAARFDSRSGGDAVTRSYDDLGRVLSSTIAMGGTARTLQYQYDVDGNRTRITHPDGVFFDMSYDARDRMVNAWWTAPGVNHNAFLGISYDAQGRRSNLNHASSNTAYAYDPISRPSTLAQLFTGNAGNVTATFAYNPASQIVTEGRDNDDYAWTGAVNTNRAYGVNGLNQYMSAGSATFGYDANGNLTSDGTTSYVYDIENRVVSTSAGAGLVYDPLGRLYRTSGGSAGTTDFLYDGDALVAEFDASNGAMRRRYMHGPGVDEPILWDEGQAMNCSGTKFLHADHGGSIIAAVNCSGNRTDLNAYDEYGIPNASNTGRFQYTGQIWIPELGMYYYKARIYSPTLGRFLQTDPIGYKDQINLYGYVGNDPIDGKDSSGLYDCAKSDCAKVAGYVKQIANAVKTLQSLSQKTAEQSHLIAKGNALLGFVGKENDGNGVNISNDSSLSSGNPGTTDRGEAGQVNIRLSFDQIDASERNHKTPGGAILAHELVHGYEYRHEGGIRSFNDVFRRERNAYSVQFGLETYRDPRTINEAARQSCKAVMDENVSANRGQATYTGHCQ